MRTLRAFILTILFTSISASYAATSEINNILEALRLPVGNSEFKDVTELESAVRGIIFSSVVIVSVPDKDPTFFPLIIYTSPKGLINDSKYDELKVKFRSKPTDNQNGLGKTMGFLFEGTDEAFVFLDSLMIASHRPSIPGVVAPLEPRTETGISIVGTMASSGTDFQIFLIGPSKKQADLYPDYKRYLESLTDFKNVGNQIYTAAKATQLLEGIAPTGERHPKSRSVGPDKPASVPSAKSDTHHETNSRTTRSSDGGLITYAWLWATGIVLALITVFAIWRKKK